MATREHPVRVKARSVQNALTKTRIYDHDKIWLTAEADVGDGVLIDRQTGTRITLNPAAERVVAELLESPGATLDHLAACLVPPGHGADLPEVRGDVKDFLVRLDQLCLIEIQGASSPFVGLKDAWRTRGMSLLTFDLIELARGGRARRYPADAVGLARACLQAQGVVAAIAVIFTAVLGVVLGIVYDSTELLTFDTFVALVLAPSMIGLVHMVTLYVHEFGHMLLAGVHSVRLYSVLTRGRRLGIRRERVSPRVDIQISLAGPLLAAGVCIVAVAVVQVVWPGFGLTTVNGMASACLLLYAVSHLASLTPVAEDGRNIARSIRRREVPARDGGSA